MLKTSIKLIWILVIAMSLVSSGCDQVFPQPTATPTPTNTPEPPTPTPIPPTETPLPTPTETPTLPPTSTPFPTIPPTPTSPPPTPSGKKAIYVYFIQKKTGGTVGCGDSLVQINTGLARTDDSPFDLRQALQRLFSYRVAEFGDLYNPLYKSELSVASIEWTANNSVSVDLSGTIKLSDDPCDGSRIFAMLTMTVRQFPNITGNPRFTLNGVGIKNFLY